MPKVQLTDRFCATAKPLNNQRTDYFDAIANGLALRVTKYGHKSWSYCFTSPRNNTWARLTLGTYPAASLALARGKALEARASVEAGIDPRFPDRASTADMTVAALVEAFLADPQRQALRTKKEIARRFHKNVVPAIGNVKLTQLKRRDVRNVTDAILRRDAKAEACRCFEDVHALIRWGVANEYMDVNPIDGMERPAKGNARTRVLSDDEIRILWDGLPEALASTQCGNVIKLCLVTGQRVGEVCGLARAELDLKAREWRLPASRSKNGHEHRIPLSDFAIDLIKDAIAVAGASDWVFPRAHGPLKPINVANTIARANRSGRFNIAPWSAHDLRRTCLDGLAKLGVLPVVIGHCANHRSVSKGGVTFAHYVQHAYEKEKRAALDLWADRLQAIITGDVGAVVPLRGRR